MFQPAISLRIIHYMHQSIKFLHQALFRDEQQFILWYSIFFVSVPGVCHSAIATVGMTSNCITFIPQKINCCLRDDLNHL
jgi:hypothetical protein